MTTSPTSPDLTRCSDAELDALLDGFYARTLPAERWTHQAHLVAGLCAVLELGPDAALERLREAIKAYNLATGGHNTETAGYHETITRFYVLALDALVRTQPPTLPRRERIRALLGSPLADNAILRTHYQRETLASPHARAHWVEPDLRPGPWT